MAQGVGVSVHGVGYATQLAHVAAVGVEFDDHSSSGSVPEMIPGTGGRGLRDLGCQIAHLLCLMLPGYWRNWASDVLYTRCSL